METFGLLKLIEQNGEFFEMIEDNKGKFTKHTVEDLFSSPGLQAAG